MVNKLSVVLATGKASAEIKKDNSLKRVVR